MPKGWEAETVFDLFGEPTARDVLARASEKPTDADTLADALGVSRPTVYRHVEELVEYGMLAEREHIDDEGNRYRTYAATLESVTFTLADGRIDVDVERAPDA
ncbi:ArsR/SmtB family transcription factor [Halosegnis marinus]|uniref:ArsR/SmtB family transcription factor n=1 Tax=Halosegnis marinus TaxID=3034023 RepID=A0ABD5ZLS5_9EURY|nr:helix-turn-helix domain-containing protein [Halosegnis sp. DT85]